MLPATAAILFSISALTALLSRPIHTLSGLVRALANVPVTPLSTLGDLSAVVQQVAVRAEQSEYFVTEIPHLRNRGKSDITNYAVRYTRFFNTIWMILNDVTIGMAFGSYLTENSSRLAEAMNKLLRMYLVHKIIFTLHWLDSWPAGLKLNTELSRFYSHMFTGFIRFWSGGLAKVMPYSTDVIHLLGILSTCGGLSLLISAIMDVVAISTAHIYACYFFAGLIYHRMLKTAGSLFNLFRGRYSRWCDLGSL
jgi:phosphatidylinositol glycan class Q protein